MAFAKKLKITDIINSTPVEIETWVGELRSFVNSVMTEENAGHQGEAVGESQITSWRDCLQFIKDNLASLTPADKEYKLIFEYCIPGTCRERPDVFLLTNNKAISLEFKRKAAPQISSNRDDVAQAIRYKEWLQNHHKETRDRNMFVKSFLVCTHQKAEAGELRGITILTKDNISKVIQSELNGETPCSYIDQWLESSYTEMPDMLQAISSMYNQGRIPYISDVNERCLQKVKRYIEDARNNHKRILILINGVPGAGKTAVGQSVVFEQNIDGAANAKYLSGNSPLVEVLQYQINNVVENDHAGENAIGDMYVFKRDYFYNNQVPEQGVLVFDEAQRAWDQNKMGRDFSEPEGLFRVCERIYSQKGYAVLIGLYGNGQTIYTGEETGISLWNDALRRHPGWSVIVSEELSGGLTDLKERKIVDNDVFLPISLRADFIDCSDWVEQAIGRNTTLQDATHELKLLKNTSLSICVTRDFNRIRQRTAEIKNDYPDWKYGLLLSNFAEASVLTASCGWELGFGKKAHTVWKGDYGSWFAGRCKELTTACQVYGNQGLELDCPIVIFGGDYKRQNKTWVPGGWRYNKDSKEGNYVDIDTIVENNYRVLLTRARREMIIFIPMNSSLDETYQYFVDMGMDIL